MPPGTSYGIYVFKHQRDLGRWHFPYCVAFFKMVKVCVWNSCSPRPAPCDVKCVDANISMSEVSKSLDTWPYTSYQPVLRFRRVAEDLV